MAQYFVMFENVFVETAHFEMDADHFILLVLANSSGNSKFI